MSKQTNIQKYLEKYADVLLKERLQNRVESEVTYDFVMVIPAHDELETFPYAFKSLKKAAKNKKLLCILVINENSSHTKESCLNNQLLIRWAEEENKFAKIENSNSKLLVLDFTGEKSFSKKEGVGRARKVGCDLALNFIEQKRVKEQFIFCSDADVIFPEDYFSRLNFENLRMRNIGALIYPFRHVADEKLSEAIAVYDLSIRLYVLGLNYAKSPYAFTTIGSTLAFSADIYASVRGIPKRAAGEDFYMLNKLLAVAPIMRLSGKPLTILGRESQRAPFGTGPAVQSILLEQNSGSKEAHWPCDRPELFIHLRKFLSMLEKYACSVELDADIFGEFKEILISLNYLNKLEKTLKTRKGVKERIRSVHVFFDALKTLRLLHEMRDRWKLTSCSVRVALEEAHYIDWKKDFIEQASLEKLMCCLELESDQVIKGIINL